MASRPVMGVGCLKKEQLQYELRVRGQSEEGDVGELCSRLRGAASVPVQVTEERIGQTVMTSRTMSALLLLLVLASPALAWLLGSGPCPEVIQLTKIDSTFMLGTWYVYKRFQNTYQLLTKCATATLERAADGSTIDITATVASFLILMAFDP